MLQGLFLELDHVKPHIRRDVLVNVLASKDANHQQEPVKVGVCFASYAVRHEVLVSPTKGLFVEEQHEPVNSLQIRVQNEVQGFPWGQLNI
jgi:hypothetical protein